MFVLVIFFELWTVGTLHCSRWCIMLPFFQRSHENTHKADQHWPTPSDHSDPSQSWGCSVPNTPPKVFQKHCAPGWGGANPHGNEQGNFIASLAEYIVSFLSAEKQNSFA